MVSGGPGETSTSSLTTSELSKVSVTPPSNDTDSYLRFQGNEVWTPTVFFNIVLSHRSLLFLNKRVVRPPVFGIQCHSRPGVRETSKVSPCEGTENTEDLRQS